jgi:hypothetical protein
VHATAIQRRIQDEEEAAFGSDGPVDHRRGVLACWDGRSERRHDQRAQQEGEEADQGIADKEIKKLAPGLSVANADKLGGQPASSYAPATTLRTAFVAGNGTVDPAHSDGVSSANVTQPVAGLYCFNGLSPAPRTVVASVAGGQATVQTQIQIAPSAGQCAGSQFDVGLLTDGNALFAEPFTVFIH